jgi:hypothetical protein
MSRFTLDSATDILFGSCVHSLSAGLPYPHNVTSKPLGSSSGHADSANEFAKAFLQAQIVIAERERIGWVWPLLEIMRDNTKEPMKVVNAYLDPIIKDALEKKKWTASEKQGVTEVRDDETLLDHLVNLTSGELLCQLWMVSFDQRFSKIPSFSKTRL